MKTYGVLYCSELSVFMAIMDFQFGCGAGKRENVPRRVGPSLTTWVRVSNIIHGCPCHGLPLRGLRKAFGLSRHVPALQDGFPGELDGANQLAEAPASSAVKALICSCLCTADAHGCGWHTLELLKTRWICLSLTAPVVTCKGTFYRALWGTLGRPLLSWSPSTIQHWRSKAARRGPRHLSLSCSSGRRLAKSSYADQAARVFRVRRYWDVRVCSIGLPKALGNCSPNLHAIRAIEP